MESISLSFWHFRIVHFLTEMDFGVSKTKLVHQEARIWKITEEPPSFYYPGAEDLNVATVLISGQVIEVLVSAGSFWC